MSLVDEQATLNAVFPRTERFCPTNLSEWNQRDSLQALQHLYLSKQPGGSEQVRMDRLYREQCQ
jgi:hypothetical protein